MGLASPLCMSLHARNAQSADRVDYIIESEPIVNKFIAVQREHMPKDKSGLNCAAFVAGIIEAILIETNFVSARPIAKPRLN